MPRLPKNIELSDLEAVTSDLWNTILTTNVVGPWNLSKEAVPHLRKTKGQILNVASTAGLRPVGSSIPYSCSKAALIQLTYLLAKCLDNIQVNVVCPGLIKTQWTSGEDWELAKNNAVRDSPLHRVGEPEDVAEGIIGMLKNTYTSGSVLTIDGGVMMRPIL